MYRIFFSVGLAIAAIGILIQYLTGVPGFPDIPPGPIILGMAALAVAFWPWRWVLFAGLAAAVFVSVGAVVAFIVKDSSASWVFPGPFLGSVLQIAGLVVALVYGTLATLGSGQVTKK